jgi:hypothetical protein
MAAKEAKMSMYEKFIADLQANPKTSILKEAKGKRALKASKYFLFGEDTEAAANWEKQFKPKDLQSAHFLVVSRLKRTQKEINVYFVLGSATAGSVIGQKVTYKKGMDFIQDFF